MMTTQTYRSIGLSLGDISAVKIIPSEVGQRLTGVEGYRDHGGYRRPL